MRKYTEKELLAEGYDLWNAKITKADLSMEEYASLDFSLVLEGAGQGVVYGGYCIGKGYLGADFNFFKGCESGTECIMRIMDVVGVSKLSDLPGKYVRVASKGWGENVKIIGNIISDKWFDYDTFFSDKKEK